MLCSRAALSSGMFGWQLVRNHYRRYGADGRFAASATRRWYRMRGYNDDGSYKVLGHRRRWGTGSRGGRLCTTRVWRRALGLTLTRVRCSPGVACRAVLVGFAVCRLEYTLSSDLWNSQVDKQ
eukprot:scaffold2348_cov66-Phaeocystis_antarctica.AAC.1